MKSRIMYIESKGEPHDDLGTARIGRVRFSKSMQTVYYRDLELARIPGGGGCGNHYDVGTGTTYWVSGPKRDGCDRLFHQRLPIEIDDDVRVEYWTQIRKRPERVNEKTTRI